MARDIGWLNSLPPDQAEQELLTCCASRRWAQKVAASRPYPDAASATAAAVAAVCELSWPEVEEALSAHPRIGDRAKAELSEQEAAWSRGEQSGAASADAAVRAELTAGNLAYEERFGHVFLIRATGRSAEEILAELRRRLDNSVPDERIKVQSELADITRLRVRKLLGDG
ncbi:2-oxo-4-hydroxy-4-carboxy-5-ureidoimidazoline decarboxylase [Nocardia tenerifensis]|uniref:2-oxo-4-hydroxy-4-carboxy-5-ureidoimidazoline decarboxylase n=1 Tax=Nocardia tenerifensis TaxID=228006 RepID=A0A318JT76_9NOCA|nr:2-oxo-4-hydroxy-4-carboxy-5-ureidoimidazoline decarboxylase [Nocardia tenerifensis]PXX58180.1 2-oxo-4-hydroxy-4-carboxy-5-ureidoimidazoline decarboxylase [Nocardia tenerifensis]